MTADLPSRDETTKVIRDLRDEYHITPNSAMKDAWEQAEDDRRKASEIIRQRMMKK